MSKDDLNETLIELSKEQPSLGHWLELDTLQRNLKDEKTLEEVKGLLRKCGYRLEPAERIAALRLAQIGYRAVYQTSPVREHWSFRDDNKRPMYPATWVAFKRKSIDHRSREVEPGVDKRLLCELLEEHQQWIWKNKHHLAFFLPNQWDGFVSNGTDVYYFEKANSLGSGEYYRLLATLHGTHEHPDKVSFLFVKVQ